MSVWGGRQRQGCRDKASDYKLFNHIHVKFEKKGDHLLYKVQYKTCNRFYHKQIVFSIYSNDTSRGGACFHCKSEFSQTTLCAQSISFS